MTDELPDYSAMEPPAGIPPAEYNHHQRRAEILQVLVEAGAPGAVTQARLAERYDVHDSTISRDMDRLRESVADNLGTEAKFTTRTLYERVVRDLLDADDWRAKKAAFDVAMDWNEWLAELGEQHREPTRSEVDVDVDSRHAEVAYTVVREGDDEPLPTEAAGDGDEETLDYEALGFTSAPAEVPIDEGSSDEQPRGGGDE